MPCATPRSVCKVLDFFKVLWYNAGLDNKNQRGLERI
jgi:hypothetical protein